MGESIVVGTDGSETATRAVTEAARLARALGAEVHIVSAIDPRPSALTGEFIMPVPDEGDTLEATLAAAAAAVRADDLSVHTHGASGSPADALLEVADAVGASTIVVGNRGMHGARRVLGSIPNTVSHRARCNVLIVSTDSR
jgi:nucleotide-binding universal stress UspA family protein